MKNRIRLFLGIVIFAFILPDFIFSAPTPTPTIGPGFVYENFETNGTIYALTRTANVLYVGGTFTKAGLRTGSFIFTDSSGMQINSPRFPQVNGTVYAIESDTKGGFYIGGTFTYVAGQPRTRLAHILSDGSLDPNWTPSVSGGAVRAIAYNPAAMSKVFVGGDFTTAAGSGASLYLTRDRLAAFDPATGSLLGFNPGADSTVYSIGINSATRIIAGGAFSVIGGLTTPYLAAIDPSSDPGTNININYGLNGSVNAIAMNASQAVIGGAFTLVNGSTVRNRLAIYGTFTSITPSAQDCNCDNTVNAVCINVPALTVYATGTFQYVNGTITARNYAAAFNLNTGIATSWNPNLNSQGLAITQNGASVSIGGHFTTVNGGSTNRQYAADFDLTTGNATAWAPNPDGYVYALKHDTVASTNIAAGGSFRGYQSVVRNNLAAINLSTGGCYAWNPSPDNTVYALALAGSGVYAGGTFLNVNTATASLARNRLAAFGDYTTAGTATAWNPNANSTVLALLPVGSSMYIGGAFTSFGSVSIMIRNYAAATDLVSGTLQPWDPDLNSYVRTLATDGTYIYAGGDLTTTAGGANTRNYAAAFDLVNGATQAWDPNLNGSVYSIVTLPGKVYAGGSFTTAMGVTRNRVAVYSTAGGLYGFDPNANSTVYSLQLNNNALLIGGAFTTLGGSTCNYFGAYDVNTWALSGWNPNSGSTVMAITGNDNLVCFGGYMTLLSFLPHGYGGVLECPKEAYTPTATVTLTSSVTKTSTPSITKTFTLTCTPTDTGTQTFTATISPTGTKTGTVTFTPTVTVTGTITKTVTTIIFSATITPTSSASPTFTTTFTRTGSPTFTRTSTGTKTATFTPTYTGTGTNSPTFTRTVTVTLTQTQTATFTPTITATGCTMGVFGNNSGSNIQLSGGSSLYASRFELLQDALVLQLNVYISSGSGMVMAAVYSDNSGSPGSLILPASPVLCSTGWNTIDIPSLPLSAGFYWLAVEAQPGVGFYYNDAQPGEGVVISNTFGTLPDPFGTGFVQESRSWSIYADFCPNAGYLVTATATPTISETWTVSPTFTITPDVTTTYTATPTPTLPPGLDLPASNDSYVYPLPASASVTFVFSLQEQADITISIFDFAGNYIRTVAVAGVMPSDTAQVSGIDISRFSTGTYYYLIKARGVSGKTLKFKLNKFVVRK
jgi:hypothetical protein